MTPPPAETTVEASDGDIAQGCEPGSELTAVDNDWEPPCLFSRSPEITVTNQGAVLHNFTLRGTGVDVDLPPGATETIDVSEAQRGEESEFYCSYHPSMVGYLAVE